MILTTYNPSFSQSRYGKIFGTVSNSKGESIPFSTVYIEGGNQGSTCDENGNYIIKKIPQGTYMISVSAIGYKTASQEISLSEERNIQLNFKLEENIQSIDEISITAEKEKSESEKVKEQSFTVNSIDLKSIQNLNMDINAVLNQSSGIRIRQDGGLGSDFNFSLNGFSGNQVRFFIDGVPSDYLGASMRFNNIPVNIIDRIEVYKGVVPVKLGSDALGGAVNIITKNKTQDFLDVSYSYSSFNTHQISLSSQYSFKNNFLLRATGFYNHSDNNYNIDATITDKKTGRISDPQEVERFNDNYTSGSVMLEGGVIRKSWADHFLFGIITSKNRKHIQQGNNMTKVSGHVFRQNTSITPTLKYRKESLFTENLSFDLSAIYSYGKSLTVDTSSRIYDWDGTYTERTLGNTAGELNWYKTKFRFKDHATLVTSTLKYDLKKKHTFTLNNTYSYFWRKGNDPLRPISQPLPFANPNSLSKNITGLSYKIDLFDKRWSTTFFVKSFYMNAKVFIEEELTNVMDEQKNNTFQHGEGIATSFFVSKKVQLKASYEYTNRLPENRELFGDGLLLEPNLDLQPEKSHNANIGVLYGQRFNGNIFNIEGGFIYRKPKNLVRLVALGVISQYQNLNSARVFGAEGSIRYAYKQWISIELNATYQDMRNINKLIDSYPDPLYLDRIPNIPYFFGNAIINFSSKEFTKHRLKIGFTWSSMFVEQFYLKWPSQGSADTKHVIPRQISHDASITFTALSGKYNISFSCLNTADTKRYDNFKVQRPGRSFSIKLRLYLSKKSN